MCEMIRWRVCLCLAMMLLIPVTADSKPDDDDEEERLDDPDDGEDDEEEDDDDEQPGTEATTGRRRPTVIHTSKARTNAVTRTSKKRPLECYVCTFKSETPLKSCLDPAKFRVHTITCHSAEDKCFTSVISQGNSYDSVTRGCRSGCVGSPDTTCCKLNRCNNQAFTMPVIMPRALSSKGTKPIPPSVFFFVTILLLLQTVVKVSFV